MTLFTPIGLLCLLSCSQVLIRAAPPELGLYAPELLRSLIHCRVPEWAEHDNDETAGATANATTTNPGSSGSSSGVAKGTAIVGGTSGVVSGTMDCLATVNRPMGQVAGHSSQPLMQRLEALAALLAVAPIQGGYRSDANRVCMVRHHLCIHTGVRLGVHT